jgi:hypothetical protein
MMHACVLVLWPSPTQVKRLTIRFVGDSVRIRREVLNQVPGWLKTLHRKGSYGRPSI